MSSTFNLPIGLLAFLGMRVFLTESTRNASRNWTGSASVRSASASAPCRFCSTRRATRLVRLRRNRDRGDHRRRGVLSVSRPHLHCGPALCETGLFRDRNFAAGTLMIAIVGLTYYASLALQPPYLQGLMNYPIVTCRLVLGPRGIGTMGGHDDRGRLVGRVDTRLLLAVGLGLTALVVLRDDRLDAGCCRNRRSSASALFRASVLASSSCR